MNRQSRTITTAAMKRLTNTPRALLLATLGAVTVSACECDVPVALEHTIEGTVLIPLGSDPDCVFDEGTELDSEGNATTTDANGTAKYHYDLNAADGRCNIVIDSWEGQMADVGGVNDEIDAQIEAAGLSPDNATVTLSEVEILDVQLTLLTAADGTYDISKLGPYRATVNAVLPDGEPSRIDAVVDVTHDGAGDPLEPSIVTTDDHQGLAAAVQRAIEAEDALGADGDAEIDVDVNDLPELTDNGNGDATLKVDYSLRVTGIISVGL